MTDPSEPAASKPALPDEAAAAGRTKEEAARARPPTAAEARAEFEANRSANKAERRAKMDATYGQVVPGRWILIVSWLCTLAFVAVTVPAILEPDEFVGASFALSLVLFFAGCALFAIDIVLAAARSRDDLMGIGGLFFLIGSAPRNVQVHLLGSLGIQVVVATAGAATHPFTPLAFGILVPMVGLGWCGLWAVRHGSFDPQTPAASRTRPE